MGEVYGADDLKLGQPVALKFLPPELERDEVVRERLLGEVRLARTISHPNVCRVYDLGELPPSAGPGEGDGSRSGRAFLTMEYIDGEDLASLLRRIGRLPPAKALEVARQLCAGLSAAHDKGVLHRDLKPANIMIDGRGQARIADFGIAVEATPDAAATDDSGTLAYMAPERFAGKPATVQSDLYALGLILYETYTGKPAFAAATQGEWRHAHTDSAPSNPSAIVADIEPAVERAILRCLAKEPAKRPASAAQVAAALPGGDPLAAAIAAGETPSPELVAASGEEGTPPRWQAWTWLAAAVVALGVVVPLRSSVLLINHVPMPLDQRALERRARDILVSIGYQTPPADWASVWVRSDGQARAALLVLAYRQSPDALFEPVGISITALRSNHQDDVWLDLDTEGHLRGLDVGGIEDYSESGATKAVNWTPLLGAIGLDRPPEPSESRRWSPAFYADTRAAWTGTIDAQPYELEAAALRGRPVSLRIRRSGAPDEPSAPELIPRGTVLAFSLAVLLGVPMVLALVARRNLRLGRGDRRGAARLAGFTFSSLVIYFVFARHWNPGTPILLIAGLLNAMWMPLTWAVLVWVTYVGIEPYVRRRWPALLIGWTRLLEGRVHDGLVGQALIAGAVAGTLLVGLRAVYSAAHMSLYGSGPTYLAGWSEIATSFRLTGLACLQGVVAVGVLVLGRLIFRRDWAAWALLLLVGSIVSVRGTAPTPVIAVESLVFGALVTAVLYRFGLLALVVAAAAIGILANAPLTLDASRWYFWRGAFGVAIVLGLALWGFKNVLGKQTLFPAGALEE